MPTNRKDGIQKENNARTPTSKIFLKNLQKKTLPEGGGLIHTGSIQQDVLFFFPFFYEADGLYLIKRRTTLLLKELTINLPEKVAEAVAVSFCFYA